MSNEQRAECPSSSVILVCYACQAQVECEVKVWGVTFTEGRQPKVRIETDVDVQPMWDHALFKHTSLE